MKDDRTGDVYKLDRGIKLKEQSSVTDEADHGILWFRDSDGQPMFTLGNGTEFPVASPPGADWQDSVLDRYDPTSATPPGPSTGDRYISTATANGWTDKYLYEYNGSSWDEVVPNEGFATWVEDEDKWYFYNGTNWVIWGNVLATSTAPADVTKAAASAGSSSELARQDHKHDISTATAGAATPGDSAAEGSATSVSRSDHQHSLPAFGTGAGTFCEGNDSRVVNALQSAHAAFTRTTSSAYGVSTQSVWHGLEGVAQGLLANFTYRGGAAASTITAYATHDSGNSTKVTVSSAHSLLVDDIITIVGTTNYNAVFKVIEIVDTTNFVIDQAWSGFDDATGRWVRPTQFELDSGFDGVYRAVWNLGAKIATSAALLKVGIYQGKTLISRSPQNIQNTTDVFNMGGSGLIDAVAGDRIWLGYLNDTNTNNPSFEDVYFSIGPV